MSDDSRSWLDEYFGPPTFEQSGVELPKRTLIELVGITAADDPVGQKTILTAGGGGGGSAPFLGSAVATTSAVSYSMSLSGPQIIHADSSANEVGVVLPASAPIGFAVLVYDVSWTAGVNRIGITIQGSDRILDGSNVATASGLVMPGQSVLLVKNTASRWLVASRYPEPKHREVYEYVFASYSFDSAISSNGRMPDVMLANSNGGAVTITLPTPKSIAGLNVSGQGLKVTIVDVAGTAGTAGKEITVVAPAGALINGASSLVLNTARASVTLLYTGESGTTPGWHTLSKTEVGGSSSASTAVPFSGTTTTATPISLGTGVALPADSLSFVDAEIVGSNTLKDALWRVTAAYVRHGSAAAVLRGVPVITFSRGSLSGAPPTGWDVTLALSANTVRAQVTGGAESIDWRGSLEPSSYALGASAGPSVSSPTVSSVSPSSGTSAGGTSVTITGTGFVATPTVMFGGVAATSVVWVSSTSLTCVTPAGTAGTSTIVVTNPDTGSGTLAAGYTYTAAAAGPLFSSSFTALPAGSLAGGSGAGTAFETATGLRYARASAAATARTGLSAVVSGLGTDVAGIGRETDADVLGLWLEESRANVASNHIMPMAAEGTWQFCPGSGTVTASQTAPDGSTDAKRMQVTADSYCGLLLGAAAPTLSSWSFWHRNRNAATGLAHALDASNNARLVGPYDTSWRRTEYYRAVSSNIFFDMRAGFNPLAIVPVDADVWGFQAEVGKFPTSLIVGGATRAAGRVWRDSLASCVDTNGRFSPTFDFSPVGSSEEYSAAMRLFTCASDTTTYAEIDATTRKLRCSVAGVTYTFPTQLSWNRGDRIKIHVAVGGGLAARAWSRNERTLNTLDLGSGTTFAALATAGQLDVLCNGTANTFSARLHALTAERSGTTPSWSASTNTQTRNVLCDGDSLTEGYGVAAGQSYPSQMDALLSATYGTVINVGISSRSIVMLRDEASTKVDPLYDAFERNILVIWAGTNDIATAGVSAATTEANLWTYCDARRAFGWKVIVLTCLPRLSYTATQADFDSARATYNAGIVANYASHADYLVNVAADNRIGDTGDNLDTTYYSSDGVHLNATGAGLIAAAVKAVVGTI